MFFVFHPIDALWLAEDGSVVEALEWFRPFSIHTPRSKAVTVIEMPAGTIRKSNTHVGDRIGFSGHP